ncbi:MAG: small-conductance mechanosensitive ion channel [Candidatus Berkelbacteria bacterium Licking1014_85]|uniref:Small-conductance mechanosensitive ion channel n=1 Tax=Candidatus Berkelbacteria bacterium Licking1014_85 TaxID=2017148 RepID=A0A554LGB4_9BACT|nr:MAG: small-conductance mechanosensitive ion channel [Candidatus Berkelbacteria bacterium Licking1014_85]
MTFSEYTLTISDALTNIVNRVITFIPSLVGAILILVVGWIVAALLEWAVENILKAIGIQTLFEKAKIEDIVKRTESKKNTSGLIGAVVKWVIILVSLIAAADVLGMTQVSQFLDSILGYVPSVVGAATILMIGAIFAHFMASVVRSSVEAAKLEFAETASALTKYAILVFSFLAALEQLGVASVMIQTLFTGLVALLAIAGGLAFGLGGQDAAKQFVEKIKKEAQIK